MNAKALQTLAELKARSNVYNVRPPATTTFVADVMARIAALKPTPVSSEPLPLYAEAEAYITALTGSADSQVCFQYFNERYDVGPAGHFVASLKEAWERLTDFHSRGCGIFATINITDGKGRCAENIIGTRVLAIEFDAGMTPPAVMQPTPDFIVHSRNGDHFYWRLDSPITPDEWLTAMKQLAAHFKSDSAICTKERVLRLPGFSHQKAEDIDKGPFMVTIEVVAA